MKRSVLTLFSGENDVLSHILRLALTEKGIAYDVEVIPADDPYENGNRTSRKPLRGAASSSRQSEEYSKATIVDRDLVISDVHIALDYLDDKFPHPSLYPNSPEKKAKVRILLKTIEENALDAMINLSSPDHYKSDQAIAKLSDFIRQIQKIWDEKTNYILGEEFSILDCYLTPVIYKLMRMSQVKNCCLPPIVAEYYKRIHSREQFINSLVIRSSRGFMHEKGK